MHTYTTKEVADAVGIHVNTVRFYEEIGFLTKPERRSNGYRVFTALHIEQCRLIRLAMRAEVLQHGLRDKAVEFVRLCAELRLDDALTAAAEYRAMIDNEILSAKAAIADVEKILSGGQPENAMPLKRKDAAAALGVTSETLRTWERSGLLQTARSENGYHVYSAADMRRLNIIKTLRLANYSLSAILRLLGKLDGHAPGSVEKILNTPEENEDIISVCDRLILSLEGTAEDAAGLRLMLENIAEQVNT